MTHAVSACLALAGVTIGVNAHAQDKGPLLLHDPTVSRSQIAFSYAGDIWIAHRDGSEPRRLTSGGHEARPAFSPDGSQVAFIGNYDGNRAVYVVPSGGGEPRRLTWHPADLGRDSIPDVVSWTPDGKRVLFDSQRAAFNPRIVQLFTVAAEGGPVAQLPLPRAVEASFSPDGTRVAYVANFRAQAGWRYYRGGQATSIQVANLADSSIQVKIPHDHCNDFNPLWVGHTIYFLSDRSGPVTLFAYDLQTQEVSEVVKNQGMDIKSAAATADGIVYDQFGTLHSLNLHSGADQILDIRPKADFPEVRPHFSKIDPAQIRYADLSPDGTRAVFGARGEILTVSAQTGEVRDVTRTTDIAEREPAWSPDGNSLAYFSDESGEYALHIRDVSKPRLSGKVRKFDLGKPPAYYYQPVWSPDSRKVGYTDQRLNYWFIDLDRKTPVKVDTDRSIDFTNGLQMAWSPDSRWIAYTKHLPNHLHAVFLYSIERGKSWQLTDGRSDALHVAFDKTGQYLYFTASTDIALSLSPVDLSSLQRPVTRRVYAILLKKNVPSPAGRPAHLDIDPGDIQQRIFALPVPAGNYYGLVAGKPGTLFLITGPEIEPLPQGPLDEYPTSVRKFDLRAHTIEPIADGVTGITTVRRRAIAFRVSFNGEKVLYLKQGSWTIASVDAPTSNNSGKQVTQRLNLDDMEVRVDPRAEWKHMFEQVWRDERDFFYDPGLHGLDLESTKKIYAPYLEHLTTRSDLNYLFSEMLGELSVSHMNISGGESPAAQRVNIGLLGADYAVENGRYRFTHIYEGDIWNPDVRAPLARPDGKVEPGEYLLAVDGRDVRPSADVYRFFEGTANRPVVLTVGPNADGTASRDITVVPVEDETPLRGFAWTENNRRKVAQLSGGRVAYIYLPDTFVKGYVDFNRDYFSQVGSQAVIVDSRYNSGGLVPDYIVDYLRRPIVYDWHLRYGRDLAAPQEAISGPKVMVTNEMAASGGELLSWMFRRQGIGPIVGKRTWGGAVGYYSSPDDLLDGGRVATPDLAFYNPDGSWDIENHGIQPDFDVDEDPKALRNGHDRQLEKAVAVVMDMLKKTPPVEARAPRYPDYRHDYNVSR